MPCRDFMSSTRLREREASCSAEGTVRSAASRSSAAGCFLRWDSSTFFAMALERGLSAAILNVNAPEMMKTWYSFRVLHGLDENCMDYVAFAPRAAAASAAAAVKSGGMNNSLPAPGPKDDRDPEDPRARLRAAIVRGLREQAASLTASLLTAESPLTLIDEEIIPALDAVGKSFEEKRTFLPQLLMSAEAAAAAFEQIKASLPQTERKGTKCRVVIATVQGDIHDIGKNIVKLLLENYGFDVIDLGKDVPPSKIVREVRQSGAPLVGLSALMTTTVPAMDETIRLLREEVPACRIIVGGAVLTADYAAKIGADAYGKDAMDTVRFAERVNEEQ